MRNTKDELYMKITSKAKDYMSISEDANKQMFYCSKVKWKAQTELPPSICFDSFIADVSFTSITGCHTFALKKPKQKFPSH